jgi:hypothetical protein
VRKCTPVASPVAICLNGLKYKAVGARLSEEKEGPESGPQGIGAGIDPTATALALAGAGR